MPQHMYELLHGLGACEAAVCAAWHSRCALLTLLPRDVLERVIGNLDVQAAHLLGSTCHLLHALSKEAVPGLHLALYPHQVRLNLFMSPCHCWPASDGLHTHLPCPQVCTKPEGHRVASSPATIIVLSGTDYALCRGLRGGGCWRGSVRQACWRTPPGGPLSRRAGSRCGSAQRRGMRPPSSRQCSATFVAASSVTSPCEHALHMYS